MLNAMLVIDPTIAANPVLASEIEKHASSLSPQKMTSDCLCSNLLPNSDEELEALSFSGSLRLPPLLLQFGL